MGSRIGASNSKITVKILMRSWERKEEIIWISWLGQSYFLKTSLKGFMQRIGIQLPPDREGNVKIGGSRNWCSGLQILGPWLEYILLQAPNIFLLFLVEWFRSVVTSLEKHNNFALLGSFCNFFF